MSNLNISIKLTTLIEKTETKKAEKTRNTIEKTENTTRKIEKENLMFQEKTESPKMTESKEMKKVMRLMRTVSMM